MDLRGIANSASNAVNPNWPASVQASTGYTPGTSTNGYKQVPTYAAPLTGFVQVQALDGADLKQLDGLNLQGVIKAIYLRGNLAGVVRATSQGGDLITIPSGPFAGVWLVAKVIEGWPDWTKVAAVLQVGG